jgi:hypothetical protein
MDLTKEIIVGIAVLVGVVDIWLVVRKGPAATISSTLLAWSKRYPIIAFLLGVVSGHLFWPNC